MTAHPGAEPTRWAPVVAEILGVIVVANVMSNRVLPAWSYVPWNLAVAAALVLLGRQLVTTQAMGFTEWGRGLAWGLTLIVLTTMVLLVAVWMPAFNDLYHDRRVEASLPAMVYHAFIRIPLGTAVLEETAFRGVLPAVFALRWGVPRGCVVASLCFGLWHVLPALGLNTVNPTAGRLFGDGAAGVAAAVVFAVVGTMAGGLFWCWIRYWSRSILSTILAHVATNSVGYVIAWSVAR